MDFLYPRLWDKIHLLTAAFVQRKEIFPLFFGGIYIKPSKRKFTYSHSCEKGKKRKDIRKGAMLFTVIMITLAMCFTSLGEEVIEMSSCDTVSDSRDKDSSGIGGIFDLPEESQPEESEPEESQPEESEPEESQPEESEPEESEPEESEPEESQPEESEPEESEPEESEPEEQPHYHHEHDHNDNDDADFPVVKIVTTSYSIEEVSSKESSYPVVDEISVSQDIPADVVLPKTGDSNMSLLICISSFVFLMLLLVSERRRADNDTENENIPTLFGEKANEKTRSIIRFSFFVIRLESTFMWVPKRYYNRYYSRGGLHLGVRLFFRIR